MRWVLGPIVLSALLALPNAVAPGSASTLAGVGDLREAACSGHSEVLFAGVASADVWLIETVTQPSSVPTTCTGVTPVPQQFGGSWKTGQTKCLAGVDGQLCIQPLSTTANGGRYQVAVYHAGLLVRSGIADWTFA